MFDDDPKFQQLKKIRESGYDGPLDQDLTPVTSGPVAEILSSLRDKGAR